MNGNLNRAAPLNRPLADDGFFSPSSNPPSGQSWVPSRMLNGAAHLRLIDHAPVVQPTEQSACRTDKFVFIMGKVMLDGAFNSVEEELLLDCTCFK